MTKTALVIGNSAYQTFSPLKNPANDARAMADSLRDMGFDVDVLVDLNLEGMHKAIQNFGKKLKKNRGLGLFFYAGHGVQVNGSNYLIPVGSTISEPDEISYRSINAEMVLKKMESAGNGFNIVIMDACRNNPFPGKSRSMQKGLAVMDAPSGSIIAYATAPGSTAADGDGKNGLYTSHLLAAMKKPGLSVEQVFKQVRIGVLEDSEGKQTPWESSSLTGHFEFVNTTKPVQPVKGNIPPPPPPVQHYTQTSHLQIISNLIGATVYVNNVNKGVISRSRALNVQNLLDKEAKVRLELSGFPSQTKKIELRNGEWQQAYFEFLPENSIKSEVTKVEKPQFSEQQTNRIVNTPISETKNKLTAYDKNSRTEKTKVSDFFKTRSSAIETIDLSPSGRFSVNKGNSKATQFIPTTDLSD